MNTPNETPPQSDISEKTLRTRTLNDTFRTTFIGGKVLITPGIQALDIETV